jgi:putative endonuclease
LDGCPPPILKVILMFYVYIIKSQKDKSLYIGSTNDLKRRFEEHNNGKSNYTRSKRPFELIYYEAFKSKTDAISRERNLKKFKKTYSELKKRINNSL